MQTMYTAIIFYNFFFFYSHEIWHGITTSQGIHYINDPKATSFLTEKQLGCPNKLSLVFH